MKKLSLTVFLLIGLSNIYAQQDLQIQGQQIFTQNINKHKDIIGTKYLTETFILAKIDGSDNNFPVRFNVYDNKFEAKNYSGEIIELEKVYSSINFIDGQIYKLISYIDKNGNTQNNHYVKHSSKAPEKLFENKKIIYIPSKEAVNGYDTDKPARYTTPNSNYIVKYYDKYYEIPTKQKDLIKLFPEKATELNTFIKSNKIKLDQEESLVKLANFLNE